jgi:hypothetical protein
MYEQGKEIQNAQNSSNASSTSPIFTYGVGGRWSRWIHLAEVLVVVLDLLLDVELTLVFASAAVAPSTVITNVSGSPICIYIYYTGIHIWYI